MSTSWSNRNLLTRESLIFDNFCFLGCDCNWLISINFVNSSCFLSISPEKSSKNLRFLFFPSKIKILVVVGLTSSGNFWVRYLVARRMFALTSLFVCFLESEICFCDGWLTKTKLLSIQLGVPIVCGWVDCCSISLFLFTLQTVKKSRTPLCGAFFCHRVMGLRLLSITTPGCQKATYIVSFSFLSFIVPIMISSLICDAKMGRKSSFSRKVVVKIWDCTVRSMSCWTKEPKTCKIDLVVPYSDVFFSEGENETFKTTGVVFGYYKTKGVATN